MSATASASYTRADGIANGLASSVTALILFRQGSQRLAVEWTLTATAALPGQPPATLIYRLSMRRAFLSD
jgi:hypothetical protein